MTGQLKQSPLHQRHIDAGAKFAEFGGWSMPLEYAGVVAEHTAVRTGVGIFDVSHLGKARVTGPNAVAFLNRCLTNDLGKIGIGLAQYTLLCNEQGGVVDDLIAYINVGGIPDLDPDDDVLLIPNAANTATVVERLRARASDDLTITNLHEDFAIIAVQGHDSGAVLTAAGFPVGHGYMSFTVAELPVPNAAKVTVCRTGYTGEKGYELVVPTDAAMAVWDKLVAAGEAYHLQPCGLGARDTLRTEMGYPLHGQDISPDISPVQARLGWAVGWKKDTFIGAEALRAERAGGPTRTLRGLVATGRGIPRPRMRVLDAEGAVIGVVTSGTFSPTLKKGVALALIDTLGEKKTRPDGEAVQVQVRKRTEAFTITKPPFVTPEVRGG